MNRRLHRQAGLSLVELMISITISLLIMSGVMYVFANSSKARTEMEKTSRQIENGSYAITLLSQDVGLAGYYGELPRALPGPAVSPVDPCATAASTVAGNMGLPVQGSDSPSTSPYSCITDLKPGTDILVVRRASSCSSANPQDTNCDAITANNYYLQVSGCSSDAVPSNPASQTIPPYYEVDTGSSANLILKKIGCASTARVLRYQTHIYFIANNNVSGDGVPTLKRWELDTSGTTIVPLVEGIENLQVDYGVDTNNDGVPETFTTDPSTVANWSNVMVLNIHVLARNSAPTGGWKDTRTYSMGLAGSTTAANDAYKRHLFTTTVRLANPAGRRT